MFSSATLKSRFIIFVQLSKMEAPHCVP
uniref:Uncharacterized protein n=1 Tax=Anguilla anguilla TaxID=7936 RepID=A0A0E9VD27_ANGAN